MNQGRVNPTNEQPPPVPCRVAGGLRSRCLTTGLSLALHMSIFGALAWSTRSSGPSLTLEPTRGSVSAEVMLWQTEPLESGDVPADHSSDTAPQITPTAEPTIAVTETAHESEQQQEPVVAGHIGAEHESIPAEVPAQSSAPSSDTDAFAARPIAFQAPAPSSIPGLFGELPSWSAIREAFHRIGTLVQLPRTGSGPDTDPVSHPSSPAAPSVTAADAAAHDTASPYQAEPTSQHVGAGTPGAMPTPLPGNRPPAYPEESRRLRQQGTVLLTILVRADGTVDSVSVEHSSGYALLDDAALKAARVWKFSPGMRDGAALECSVKLPMNFVLRR